MFKIISVLALVLSSTGVFGAISVQVPLNDPSGSSFNVQVRHYLSPRDTGSAEFKCIGTIITLRHVLTVASCVWNKTFDDIILMVGSTLLDWRIDNSQLHDVNKIEIHPNYTNGQPMVANVAVLTVSLKKKV